jgi:hypothetical protein
MLAKEGAPLPEKEIARRLKLAKKHADKFPNPRQFALKYPSLWNFLRGQGLVDEVFPNRKQYHPEGYWTPETVGQEATKYNSKIEFFRGNQMAFKKAVEFGILNTLFPIDMRGLNAGRKPSFTLDQSINLAKDFQGMRSEFYKQHPAAYRVLKDNNLLTKYFGADMRGNKVPEEILLDAAKKYDNIIDLRKNDNVLYAKLKIRGLLDTLYPNDYRTEKLIHVAKQYPTRFELKRNNKRVYLKVLERGLMDDIFPPEKGLSLTDLANDLD